jgi:hypothetical protein
MLLIRRGVGTTTTPAGDSAAAVNFLARTSLTSPADDLYINAYKAFLNGLTTDGLFNSDGSTNFFDFLYIWATKDQATALLNLVSANFPCTNTGGLTFTANSGFAGANNPAQVIDSQFNPTTASSPKFTQDSAHLSIWNLGNTTSFGPICGASGDTTIEHLIPKFTGDGNLYARINDASSSGGFSITDSSGHIIGNRSSSTGREAYQNGSTTLNGGTVVSYGSTPSTTPVNANIIGLANVQSGSEMSAGASLNATQASNFYSRLRSFMTSVGVP